MLCKILLLAVIFAATMADETLEENWENYKKTYNKVYDDPSEDAKREKIFNDNVKAIKAHNKKYDAKEVSWKMGINQFTDLTEQEFKDNHLGLRRPDGAAGVV